MDSNILSKLIVLILALVFAVQGSAIRIDLKRQVKSPQKPNFSAHLKRFTDLLQQEGTVTADEGVAHSLIKEMLDLINVQYVGEVFLGHNLESYNMVFDTGSNYAWVIQEQSPLLQTQGANPYTKKGFVCHGSPTCFIDYDRMTVIALSYGTGNAQGVVFTDRFSLGGNLVVDKVELLLVLGGFGT